MASMLTYLNPTPINFFRLPTMEEITSAIYCFGRVPDNSFIILYWSNGSQTLFVFAIECIHTAPTNILSEMFSKCPRNPKPGDQPSRYESGPCIFPCALISRRHIEKIIKPSHAGNEESVTVNAENPKQTLNAPASHPTPVGAEKP